MIKRIIRLMLFMLGCSAVAAGQRNFPDSAKIIMVGNSITNQGDWKKILDRSDVTNWGIPGYTTEQLGWTFKNYIQLRPKVCFLEGGINDLTLGISPQRVYRNQVRVIDSLISHQIIPVIQSTIFQNPSADHNRRVKKVNRLLSNFCAVHHIDYLDLNSVLSSNGYLKLELTKDGTHLRPEAYLLWAELVRNELIKLKL